MTEKRHRVTLLLAFEDYLFFSGCRDDRGSKKSTLVARLIRDYLDREGFPGRAIRLGREAERAAFMTNSGGN